MITRERASSRTKIAAASERVSDVIGSMAMAGRSIAAGSRFYADQVGLKQIADSRRSTPRSPTTSLTRTADVLKQWRPTRQGRCVRRRRRNCLMAHCVSPCVIPGCALGAGLESSLTAVYGFRDSRQEPVIADRALRGPVGVARPG